jgi:aminoglycoside phosphotransferase (APT) family kinase protein
MIVVDLSDRLLDVLRTETGCPGLSYARSPQPLTGGFWAELLQFSVSGAPRGWPAELVARLMPDEAMARKETAVQRAVADAGYPTPVVRVSGGPSSGLGPAFMIMDRAPGGPLLAGLNGVAALVRAPLLARRIPDVLARSMASLHALDPAPVRAELDGMLNVVTDVPSMLEALRSGAEACGRDDLVAAAATLASRLDFEDPDVICHGDLHPFNLLVDDHGTVTVLDWTASLIAPRPYDVAFTSLLLAEPPLALPDRLRPAVRSIGRRLAKRFVRSYERDANVVIERDPLTYFQAVVCLRALVEVAHWVAGGVIDERTGHPWLTNGVSFAARLAAATKVEVRPR